MFSCIMAVLAVNLTTWTLSLNMTGQISSLYHLPTLSGTLHSLKLTTITVCKVIVDVIQFTLPLTTFLLVSTVYVKRLLISLSSCLFENVTNFSSRQTGQALVMAVAFLTLSRQELQKTWPQHSSGKDLYWEGDIFYKCNEHVEYQRSCNHIRQCRWAWLSPSCGW